MSPTPEDPTASSPNHHKSVNGATDNLAEQHADKPDGTSTTQPEQPHQESPLNSSVRFGAVEIVPRAQPSVTATDDDDADDKDYVAEEEDEEDAEGDGEDAAVAEGNGESEGEVDDIPSAAVAAAAMPDLPKGLLASLLASGGLGEKPLHAAAAEGDVHRVKELLAGEWKGSVDDEDIFLYTPLHMAAEKGHVDVCKVLIAEGAALEKTTKMYGSTALHYAAFEGHEGVVRMLVEAGAELDAVTNDLRTPLYQAAFKGHLSCVRALLEHGADATMKSSEGKCPGDVAASPEISAALTEGPPSKKQKPNPVETTS